MRFCTKKPPIGARPMTATCNDNRNAKPSQNPPNTTENTTNNNPPKSTEKPMNEGVRGFFVVENYFLSSSFPLLFLHPIINLKTFSLWKIYRFTVLISSPTPMIIS
jgi:hypothetical protein